VTTIEEIAAKKMLELFKNWDMLMQVRAGYGETNPGFLASSWIGSPLRDTGPKGIRDRLAFYETHRAPDM
jgi:hypothetical protein